MDQLNSSKDTDSWADSVIGHWKAEGIDLGPGATLTKITKTESFLAFSFPESFKTLYERCNGFQGLGWNEHMFCFWSLERIIEEYDPDSHPNFIGFCDFLISTHFIGFHKGKSGIFKRYNLSGDAELEKIAGDFQQAVDLINSSADNVY